MAIIQSPPNSTDLIKFVQKTDKLFDIFSKPGFLDFVRDVNNNYYHWHELRHRPIPGGISSEEAWAFIKLI